MSRNKARKLEQTTEASQSYLSLHSLRRARLTLFLLLFVVISATVVFAFASPKSSKSGSRLSKKTGQLSLRYVQEKPTRLVGGGANSAYVSRARQIDISQQDVLYCTPEDDGVVTSRRLSAQEVNRLHQAIDKAIGENGAEDVDRRPNDVLVNSYQGLTITIDGRRKQNRVYSPDAQSNLFKSAVTVADQLCAAPAQTIEEAEVPAWDGETSQSTTPPAASMSVLRSIVPKAYAGGTTVPSSNDAAKLVDYTNQQRANYGLKPLYRADCLDNSAYEWSAHLAATNTFYHSTPIAVLMEKYCNKNWGALGENLALASNAELAINGLMNSKVHRDAILNPSYNRIGIATAVRQDGRLVFTQHFWADKNQAPLK